MSAAKRHNSSTALSEWIPRGLPWLFGPGRPVLVVLLLFGLFGGGWYWTWQRVGPRVLSSPEYRVEFDKLEVTRRPKWMHGWDVRGDVFRELNREGPLNAMDDGLVQRVSAAFAQQPWVAKVVLVRKQSPAGVKVDLLYRQPVCVVETPLLPLPLPVDAESVLLPGDHLTPLELNDYPRLVGVDHMPTGLAAGRRWSDARVIGGAEIAAALAPVWKELKLQRIQPTQPRADGWTSDDSPRAPAGNSTAGTSGGRTALEPVSASIAVANSSRPVESQASRPAGECTFWLITRAGTPIFWNYAPGAHVAGELQAVDKIARLRTYFAEHDSLDTPNHQPLDIRTMKPGTTR